MANEEKKAEDLSKLLEKNKNENKIQNQSSAQKPKKNTPKKAKPQPKPKAMHPEEYKAEIEEIKKKLKGKVDFSAIEEEMNQRKDVKKTAEKPQSQMKPTRDKNTPNSKFSLIQKY